MRLAVLGFTIRERVAPTPFPEAPDEPHSPRPVRRLLRQVDRPAKLPALIQSVEREPIPTDDLAQVHAGLYGLDFERRAQRLELLRQNRDVLALVERQHKAGEIDSFRYGSRRYDSADAAAC